MTDLGLNFILQFPLPQNMKELKRRIDMNSNNHRILLHITMVPSHDPEATKKADSTYFRLNNILKGNGQLPNIVHIRNYCNRVNQKLGAYICNKCLDIKKDDALFAPHVKKSNSVLNIFESSERKNIRIVLYPGEESDINDLNMTETTHNMIVRFVEGTPNFSATEIHAQPPSFYQRCASEDTAMLYLEALLVDACVCHYLGVSDVAFHHDEKQQISTEKVLFLREIVKNKDLSFLSPGAKRLVNHVASQLSDNTPYISFLSIFTIAPLDLADDEPGFFFEDYCRLWDKFQKWYFNKHGRRFSKQKKLENPLGTVFNRNKYQGQISPSEIATRIEEKIKKPAIKIENPPFGDELRYAVIIIKRMPENYAKVEQFEALFSGKLHQAKWDIIYWGDLEKYEKILPYLEIVPFMIDE